MKQSNRHLLILRKEVDAKLTNEGFFDDIMKDIEQAKSDRAIDKAHFDQKEKERERYRRATSGRAIPPRLSKANLRKYYTMRAMPIPKELEGLEDDHSAYKRSPSAVGRQQQSKSADFIGSALGLDPTQQKGLDNIFKAGGDAVSGIAGASAAAYNYIKNLFGSKQAKEALPKIEKASEEAVKKDGSPPVPEPNFTSLSSIASILAGIPSNQEFNYVHIRDFEKSFDSAYPSLVNSPIDENLAMRYIDTIVSDIILGKDRKTINKGVKKVEWKVIYENIKKDNINLKAGMGYMSGHYVVVKTTLSGRQKQRLVPIGMLRRLFPNLDINDLEN